MRINIVISLIALTCLHVSAKVHAQKINLTLKDATIEQAFQQIQQKSGFEFFYDSRQIKQAKRVTLSFREAELKEILDACFKDQPFGYDIQNKTIVVVTPSTTLPDKKTLNPSSTIIPIRIRGRVTDKNNTPLPAVSIRVRGTNVGTVTDQNGNYTIEAEPDAILVFSSVGFQTMQIMVNGKTEHDLTLVENEAQLQETVIKGYYSTTKALNTGSVSTVKGDVLVKQPVGNPLMALEGRVPGLYITQTSGVPGSAMNVRLRGQNSIANGNEPLYILDGVPFNSSSLTMNFVPGLSNTIGEQSPFTSLRMNDIESIEVLKDADATAIYGSRGANGVILIITKKGKPGKARIDAMINQGAGKVSNKLSLMNTEQYLEMRRTAFKNDGTNPAATDYDLNGTWGDINKYTDWQDVMIGGTAHMTDAQVNLSGGNANTQFLIGSGYRRETTVFPGEYNNKKNSFNFNINHDSDDHNFKVSLSGNYMKDKNALPLQDYTEFILLPPNAPLSYNADGSLNWQNNTWSNPLWSTVKTYTSTTDNLNANLNLSYQIISGLTIGARLGYNQIELDSRTLQPLKDFNPAITADPILRTNIFSSNKRTTWIAEPNVTYNKILGDGKLETLLGATFQGNDQKGIAQTAAGFSTDALLTNVAAASQISTNSTIDAKYSYAALFARIGYNYKERYLINITGRRDGSSRFGPGRKFGNFGAVGAGWIFSKEQFLAKASPILSFGKIRASYGITGNDQLGDYRFLSTYGPTTQSTGYQGVIALEPKQLTNPLYAWETVRKLEAGVELGFINDRVYLSIGHYRNRTGNQLVEYPLPATTGFRSVLANLPAVLQNTGWEFELTTENFRKAHFSWTTSLNLSIPRNKLVSFPNLAGSSYASRYVVGQSLNLGYRYHYTGVDPQTGLYTFQDLNGDGLITNSLDRIPVIGGQDFFGGFNNSLSFHSFQLDVFLQFVKQKGNKFFNGQPPGTFFNTNSNYNQPTSIINNRDFVAYSALFSSPRNANYSTLLASDFALMDKSFVRVKNISLSYDLPKTILNTVKLQKARAFLQGQNLFTITKYEGLDPEITLGSTSLILPPLKVITAGLQIQL